MKHIYTNKQTAFSPVLVTVLWALMYYGMVSYASAQTVRIQANGWRLERVLEAIKKQTGYTVFARQDLLENSKPVHVSGKAMNLREFLSLVLKDQPLQYRIQGKEIIFSEKKRPLIPDSNQQDTLSGMVYDGEGTPLADASVTSERTEFVVKTDRNGRFLIPVTLPDRLTISFVGYNTQTVFLTTIQRLEINLEQIVNQVDDVVITGIVDRKKESFTGSSTTITQAELRRAGAMNVFQSLRNLDPSLITIDNRIDGSNPNIMPEMQIRGVSSFPDIRGQYTTSPNQPLFIVDGFEMRIEKVNDLSINRIESITILKDASAKALYGARAANGVIVIETIKVKPGELRVRYIGSYGLDHADLSSYHLTNAREKLQLENQLGAYVMEQPIFRLNKDSLYYANLLEVENGVNTDWLSQPVRDGFTHKQTVEFEVGDERLRAGLSLQLGNVQGVMKGSSRKNLGGAFSLIYRHRNLIFRNLLQYTGMKSNESPYGSFSDYALLNPYWRPYNEDGGIRKFLGNGPVLSEAVYNPMYNATLNTRAAASYTDLTNNTYLEWFAGKGVKLTGRFGFTNTRQGSERFLPGSHTDFIGYVGEDALLQKGSFDQGFGTLSMVSGDINLNYSKHWGQHLLFTNIGGNIREDKAEHYLHSAIGFPNSKMDNIIFAKQYASDAKPTGSESINREIGALALVNYSYDNRYFTDLSLRTSASSQFGSDNRWGTFWSIGAGWNLHNESFAHGWTFLQQLKLRGSIGYTGSQNFDSYQSMLLYNYFVDNSYQGYLGTYLNGLANPSLKWQQKLDYNAGVDLNIRDRFNLRLDVYRAVTTHLLTDITTPPSLGFRSYKANLGEIENKGIDFKMSYRAFVNADKRQSLNMHIDGLANSNRIIKISNSLKTLTQELDEQSETSNTPLLRFEEGQSLDAIWAVRSLGIDPATGKEIYVKKDGSVTDTWDVRDKVVVGVNRPKFSGNFGVQFERLGFSVGVIANYRIGGQIYNQTLVDKVENALLNYNVDTRAYYDAWKNPGDEVLFRNIGNQNVVTLATSRFVQDLSEWRLAAVHLGYDFYRHPFVQKMKLERLQLLFNGNDVWQFSTVRNERGTAYPFARYFSLTIVANY